MGIRRGITHVCRCPFPKLACAKCEREAAIDKAVRRATTRIDRAFMSIMLSSPFFVGQMHHALCAPIRAEFRRIMSDAA